MKSMQLTLKNLISQWVNSSWEVVHDSTLFMQNCDSFIIAENQIHKIFLHANFTMIKKKVSYLSEDKTEGINLFTHFLSENSDTHTTPMKLVSV